MGVVGVIVIFLLALLGGFYIYSVNKLGKLNDAARNAAGELDTFLWDRNHVLTQLISKMEELGISVPDEQKEEIPLALGMPASMQIDVYTRLFRRGNFLFDLLKEHPDIAENEAVKKLTDRFTALRGEIAASGSRYNMKATAFNAYIEKPLGGFLAARKHLFNKNHFSIELAEAGGAK